MCLNCSFRSVSLNYPQPPLASSAQLQIANCYGSFAKNPSVQRYVRYYLHAGVAGSARLPIRFVAAISLKFDVGYLSVYLQV